MMNKLLILTSFLLIFATSAIAGDTFSYTYEGKTIEYYILDEDIFGKSCGVESNNDISGDVVLPEIVYNGDEAYRLITLGLSAFEDCTGLTSITLPNSVEFISFDAFGDCINLTSIKIPNSVKEIYNGAFRGCTGLKSITLPNSLEYLGGGTFQGCTGLTSIRVPNSVEYIDANTFKDCINLSAVDLPTQLKEIRQSAFEGCSSLQSIDIPYSVTKIGYSVFSGCTSLKSIVIPNSVTSIGDSVFSGCTNLTSFSFPNNLKSVGEAVFEGCTKLSSINIPNSVTEIWTGVFKYCSGLTEIKIPNSVETIGNYAFDGCTNLTSIILPNSVRTIGNSAFYHCTSLTSINFPNSLINIEECAFWGCTSLTSADLSNTSIERFIYDIFGGCSSLTSIELPSSTLYVDSDLFWGVDNLKYVTCYAERSPFQYTKRNSVVLYVPKESINDYKVSMSIGSFSFQDIQPIEELDFSFDEQTHTCTVIGYNKAPDGELVIPAEKKGYPVTGIGKDAFLNCNYLTSIILPSTIQVIEGNAFAGCAALESIECKAVIPPAVSATSFSDFDKITLSVPFNSIESYQDHEVWKNFYNIDHIEFLNYTFDEVNHTYTVIGFLGKKETNLIIPAQKNGYPVTGIGEYAFSDCTEIQSITFPNTLQNIDKGAFQNCESITQLMLPESLKQIDSDAFYGCENIESITCLATTPPSITANSFSHYENIILIVPEESREDYQNADFWKNFLVDYDENFTYSFDWNTHTCTITGYTGDAPSGSLIIPSEYRGYTITGISGNVFAGCTNLSSIQLPNTIEKIGERAFMECTGLSSFTIPSTVKLVGNSALANCSGIKVLTFEDDSTPITIEEGNNLAALEVLNLGRDLNVTKCFQGRNTLTVVNISESVSEIPADLFLNCRSLRSITIPQSVNTVGERAFSGCVALKSINIQDGETPIRIEASTLSDGRGSTFASAPIQTIYMGRNVEYTSTELSPFKNITELTDLTIGNKVSAINNYLFYGCTNISNLAVPSSVKKIGDYSFYDCTESTLLIISSSVESIGEYAFYNCRHLSSISIPNSVQSIGDYAFRSCVGTKKIKIGNSLKNIGAYAFLDCRSATEIELGSNVESIGDNAFYNCTSLKEIILPDKVVSIGNNAFTLCASAEKLYIGKVVSKIGTRAFSDCENLKEVTCAASRPPVADDDTFSEYTATLRVPKGCLSSYKNDYSNCWYLFKTIEVDNDPVITPSKLELNLSEIGLYSGESMQLVVTKMPEGSVVTEGLTWRSSNSRIASVDNEGLVKAISLAPGECEISVFNNEGWSATCKVTVKTIPVESIILDPDRISCSVGDKFTIKATVLPENASNKELKWMATGSADVDQNGNVEIWGADHNIIIRAKATDGSSVEGTCYITSTSGIEAIFDEHEDDELISVFSPDGLVIRKDCSREDLKELTPGLYILKSKKKNISVLIR
ncbi:MAG: leucine-rich repeat protein [Muribaculaceae bacterium]|nr:leucine-rich repeat protein [Muribaculaceae bacterium]